jgi:hypothetical protein
VPPSLITILGTPNLGNIISSNILLEFFESEFLHDIALTHLET